MDSRSPPSPGRRRAVLGLACALLAPTSALAQARARFRVEIIAFRQPGAAAPGGLLALPEPTGQASPVELLPAADWQLGNLDAALRRSAGYRVLGHSAWTLAVPPNGSATARLEDVLGTTAGLAGSITVQRGQYLFLRVDLQHAAPEGGVHRLEERRRIRFDERHYFDHPAIGLIAQVSPVRSAG